MELYYSPKFVKSYKKLPKKIKDLAQKKIQLFIGDRHDPLLRAHKLHGDFAEFSAFSVNSKYRIVFDFFDENIVRFYDIGTHDIYY